MTYNSILEDVVVLHFINDQVFYLVIGMTAVEQYLHIEYYQYVLVSYLTIFICILTYIGIFVLYCIKESTVYLHQIISSVLMDQLTGDLLLHLGSLGGVEGSALLILKLLCHEIGNLAKSLIVRIPGKSLLEHL